MPSVVPCCSPPLSLQQAFFPVYDVLVPQGPVTEDVLAYHELVGTLLAKWQLFPPRCCLRILYHCHCITQFVAQWPNININYVTCVKLLGGQSMETHNCAAQQPLLQQFFF